MKSFFQWDFIVRTMTDFWWKADCSSSQPPFLTPALLSDFIPKLVNNKAPAAFKPFNKGRGVTDFALNPQGALGRH